MDVGQAIISAAPSVDFEKFFGQMMTKMEKMEENTKN